jgi:hypothetical protein
MTEKFHTHLTDELLILEGAHSRVDLENFSALAGCAAEAISQSSNER